MNEFAGNFDPIIVPKSHSKDQQTASSSPEDRIHKTVMQVGYTRLMMEDFERGVSLYTISRLCGLEVKEISDRVAAFGLQALKIAEIKAVNEIQHPSQPELMILKQWEVESIINVAMAKNLNDIPTEKAFEEPKNEMKQKVVAREEAKREKELNFGVQMSGA